jgi:hypothetical protein
MKIVTDFFRSIGEFRDPATIPSLTDITDEMNRKPFLAHLTQRVR